MVSTIPLDLHPIQSRTHIVEKLWTAGACLHREGSREQAKWVGEQANRLRRGAASAVLEELRQRLAEIPRTGPGNKGKRKRLGDIVKHHRKEEPRPLPMSAAPPRVLPLLLTRP